MNEVTRPRKKLAYVKRAEVYAPFEDAAVAEADTPYGDCWVAVDDEGRLISVSTDIATVSQAAKFSGFWIADQDAA